MLGRLKRLKKSRKSDKNRAILAIYTFCVAENQCVSEKVARERKFPRPRNNHPHGSDFGLLKGLI
jgi:hypothetical protein